MKEWEAIGKVLAKGFNDTGYFPRIISKSFVQYCFYGDIFLIVEIARQEVTQKPHLMASCRRNVFHILGKTKAFADISSLNNLYRQLEPTTKKLIILLKLDPSNDSERDAFGYFKRFIRIRSWKAGEIYHWIRFINCSKY